LKESDLIGSLREIQWLDFLANFNLSSSRPNTLITTPYGVTNPKKIIPSTMGLTIIPSKSPNRIHSLFSGKRMSSFTNVITKSANDVAINAYAHVIFAELKKKTATTANTNVKKNPNFLFDGSSISENFMTFLVP
tara:strand:+ start:85 stop:489 length:405 start_codon:yes stop_codon:yes gene_type:complete